jgi:hypothetical protein
MVFTDKHQLVLVAWWWWCTGCGVVVVVVVVGGGSYQQLTYTYVYIHQYSPMLNTCQGKISKAKLKQLRLILLKHLLIFIIVN